MTNVGGLIAAERILSDIRSMIPDSLKGAGNEDKVQVTRQKLRSPPAAESRRQRKQKTKPRKHQKNRADFTQNNREK
jgi:hypothetical protein